VLHVLHMLLLLLLHLELLVREDESTLCCAEVVVALNIIITYGLLLFF
jgi:hypothetical protein